MDLLEQYYNECIYSEKYKDDSVLRDKLFNELSESEKKRIQNSLGFTGYKLGKAIDSFNKHFFWSKIT